MVFRMVSSKRAQKAGGFAYIGLLISVAVIGIGLGATSEVWTQTRQREKEDELLFVGNQIRQAITRFYLQSPPAARRFPMTLEELLEDTRTPDKPARFLRKLYADPISNATRWGEVRLPSGQLVGVYSESNDRPLKLSGFAQRDNVFEDKEHYSDWVFRSSLPAANPMLSANGSYSTNSAPVAPPTAPTTAPNTAPATSPGIYPQRPPTPLPPGVIQPVPRTR